MPVFTTVYLLVIVAVPALTMWGWIRWKRRTQRRALNSDFSFFGFLLATGSAGLAVLSAFAASIRRFAYFDPVLLVIYKIGLLLALGGLVMGIFGVSRPGPVRWHAPLCGLGMLAFWIIAASME
jgi:hypothetical protein